MSDMTTNEINQKGRIDYLEELLEKIDMYLNVNAGMARDSMAHREIKQALGKTKYGERVVYQDE